MDQPLCRRFRQRTYFTHRLLQRHIRRIKREDGIDTAAQHHFRAGTNAAAKRDDRQCWLTAPRTLGKANRRFAICRGTIDPPFAHDQQRYALQHLFERNGIQQQINAAPQFSMAISQQAKGYSAGSARTGRGGRRKKCLRTCSKGSTA